MVRNKGSNTSRWGLLATAFIAGALLCLTAIASYRSAGELFDVAGTGQAEAFLRALRREAQRFQSQSESLKEFLEDNEDLGLRYIGFFTIEGQPVSEAGKPSPEKIFLPEDPRERTLVRIGDRLRFTTMLPPRISRRMMGMGPGLKFEPEEEGGQHLPRRLVLEFEPLLWKQMQFRLHLTLLGVFGASGLLMGSAVILYRMNKKAAEDEANRETQKRLASLGEMTAVLAHEIKNPLAALKGQAQLLEESLERDEAAKARASIVVTEAVRLQNLINELLDFAKSNNLNLTSESPASVLAEAVAATWPDRIDIDGFSAPQSWRLDRPKLVRALANLLRNAVQASPEGARVMARVAVSGGALVFEVEDQGEGVPVYDREKIFEPFQTGRIRGVGLGLAVVRKVAESHGGSVSVREGKGGGALFTIILPGKSEGG